jgi:hypothetical protein
MMALRCASSCLPLFARQGPSLQVLRLFQRLLVLRNLVGLVENGPKPFLGVCRTR